MGGVDRGGSTSRGDSEEEGFSKGVDVVIVCAHLVSGIIHIEKETLGYRDSALGNPSIRFLGKQ